MEILAVLFSSFKITVIWLFMYDVSWVLWWMLLKFECQVKMQIFFMVIGKHSTIDVTLYNYLRQDNSFVQILPSWGNLNMEMLQTTFYIKKIKIFFLLLIQTSCQYALFIDKFMLYLARKKINTYCSLDGFLSTILSLIR